MSESIETVAALLSAWLTARLYSILGFTLIFIEGRRENNVYLLEVVRTVNHA